MSFDDGAHWQPLQLDLPVTPVTDMAFPSAASEALQNDLVVSTMGRGFQVLRDLTPLRRLDGAVAAAAAHLYPPATATLARWRTGGWGYTADPMDPEFGEPGAVVDWVLDVAPDSPVVVELLDESGAVLNGWSSEESGYQLVVSPSMRGEERLRVGGPSVPRKAGHTRFVAPLQHAGAWTMDRDGAASLDRSGPAVAPGRYSVRVSAGAWSATRPLTVVMDPRVREAGVTSNDLEEQEGLALAVRELMSRAAMTLAEVEARMVDAGGADLERLRTLHRELTEREDVSYPQPMLLEQIGYLYGMVAAAPQRVGRDAFTRYDQLRTALKELEARL